MPLVDRFPLGLFIVSLLVALLIDIYPLRGDMAFWRPPMALLVILYWILCEPFKAGVGLSWCVGLGLDLMFGTVLGQQALAMGICAYILKVLGRRLHHFSLAHQTVLIVLLVVLYQTIVATVAALLGRGEPGWALFYPALSSAVVWPLLIVTMQALRRCP